MSPVTNRTSGRRFGGGFDTQKVERFAPGARGEAYGAGVLWTQGVQAKMKASKAGSTTMKPQA